MAYMYYACTYIYLLSEVQVDVKPSFQDAGVQCDIIPYTECTPTTTDTAVQCDIECPLFVSTPRIDCYSTSETELSDASQGMDTSTGMYHPSMDIPSSLS